MKKETVTKYFLLATVLLAVVFAFAMKATIYQKPVSAPNAPLVTVENTDFTRYWFSGKAEINSYKLEQTQGQGFSQGQAILIFGTEDFRTDKQVRSEGEKTRDRSIHVLHSSLIRKWVTGLSDYSLSTSVFTPIDSPLFPNTLKVSTSTQDWSGHSYLQLNLRTTGYQVSGRSYIEEEAEEEYTTDKALLEDELWNRIRLAPEKLPTGTLQLIPGTQLARLRHQRLGLFSAELTLSPYTGNTFTGDSLHAYSIDYKVDKQKLLIVFENKFPYRIVGWEETYISKGKLLTARAIVQQTIQTDYWNHNAPADTALRKSLTIQ